MKQPLFTGAATAVVTPFRDGRPDMDAFARLIDRQYAGGVSALVVCGTTGEAATLTPAEQERLIRAAADRVGPRMTVIAGIGSNDTKKALEAARMAAGAGAAGALMVTPYYNKTTQKGLVSHFSYVADRSPIPLILYNVPSRTGVGIAPETYARLSEHPNINGVKEAGGDLAACARAMSLCGQKEDGLCFWSGNDSDTVPMMALGAKGVISVASNLIPGEIARLCGLCLRGDFPAAAAMNARYTELYARLFSEVNPIPVKAAMAMLGLCGEDLRLPLVPMDPDHRAALARSLRTLGLIA